jgi:hypothetical protein
MYEIYKLSKSDLGKYLNTWFTGKRIMLSDIEQHKVKFKKGTLKDYLCLDEVWTVKRVDDKTSQRLYNRDINPISIIIMAPASSKFIEDEAFKRNEAGETLYNMKCMIHSVDDSSFGIWFNGRPLSELEPVKHEMMKWVNSKPIINGDEFINKCIELGAEEDSIDYN